MRAEREKTPQSPQRRKKEAEHKQHENKVPNSQERGRTSGGNSGKFPQLPHWHKKGAKQLETDGRKIINHPPIATAAQKRSELERRCEYVENLVGEY